MHSLWRNIVKLIGRYHRRSVVWYAQRTLEVRREVRGDGLFDAEADLLGQLFEMPHWKALLKYLDIERQSTLNNGLVLADDLLKVGEVKGDIGRCNKIEADVRMFWEDLKAKENMTAVQKRLAAEEDEEQSDAI
jgi:hypothetical protein